MLLKIIVIGLTMSAFARLVIAVKYEDKQAAGARIVSLAIRIVLMYEVGIF